MNHEVEVSNLMFNKSLEEKIDFKKYDINIDLQEEDSNQERTILKYSLDLTSNPKNSVINISGNTILNGEQSEIEKFLKQESDKTPQVVSLIYEDLFPLMYIISKNMKIPVPSHTISQNQLSVSDSGSDSDITKKIDVSTNIDKGTTNEKSSENQTEISADEVSKEEIKKDES